MAVFLADGPGVQVADRIGPGLQRNAAMGKVVIFLDRRIQHAHRRREPAGRVAGEIIAEDLGTWRRSGGGEKNQQSCSYGHVISPLGVEERPTTDAPRIGKLVEVYPRRCGAERKWEVVHFSEWSTQSR